jgi:PAS domain S-box-containing protein
MSHTPTGPVDHERVLVVDDNAASLYTTSRILRAGGYEVVEVVNGAEALAAADNVSLVVLDVNLPDIDGFEVCRQLRARTETAYLPIVQLSAGFVNKADIAVGLHAGADSYLTHPVDPTVLIATVRALLFARQADEIRRVSDSRFRTVFEHASSGIAILDNQLMYSDVNAAFCQIVGREREQLIGTAADGLLPEDHWGHFGALAAGADSQRWEGATPLVRGDGSLAAVEWRIVRERTGGSWIAVLTDITERRRSEEERERLLASERAARSDAERSNRLKDEFLATLSHELRNPLSAILGWASVLKRTPDVPPVIIHGLDAIERNSRVQTHLIEDLLDFAGIRFGKMRLDLEAVQPAPAINAALDVVREQARKKGVEINNQGIDEATRVVADESRLQQIVVNLLTNAVKFTPKGGRIDVTGGVADGRYQISVADTGSGISPEFLPQIFDRFSQQDGGTAKRFAGLGIGLSIVKHLVDMHQGTIEATSAGSGHGARFVVTLPVTTAPVAADPRPATLSGVHVLVVEDDGDARALIARILTDVGARVSEAGSADEALAQVYAAAPDVLVSDIGMAKQDGYQLLRALRSSAYPAERLPAIALTAFSRAQDRSDALGAGFQMHLTKPVRAEALISAVSRLMATRAPPQALSAAT